MHARELFQKVAEKRASKLSPLARKILGTSAVAVAGTAALANGYENSDLEETEKTFQAKEQAVSKEAQVGRGAIAGGLLGALVAGAPSYAAGEHGAITGARGFVGGLGGMLAGGIAGAVRAPLIARALRKSNRGMLGLKKPSLRNATRTDRNLVRGATALGGGVAAIHGLTVGGLPISVESPGGKRHIPPSPLDNVPDIFKQLRRV